MAKAKTPNPNSKSILYDSTDIIAGWIMPWVVKIFLNALSVSQYDAMFKSKEAAWNTASLTIPFLFRRFTHLSDFYDDLIGDFFEEVKREIKHRKEGKIADKDENTFRAIFLDMILEKDPEEAKKLIKVFNNLFTNLTIGKKQDLINFLASLSEKQVLAFLSLEEETRKNFLSFLGINESESDDNKFFSFLRDLKEKIKEKNKDLNNIFSPESSLAIRAKNFRNKMEEFYNQSKK